VDNLFTLPPSAFSPPPKVHSSVLRLTVRPRFDELKVETKTFIPFLRAAFAMKRKTLLNNLKPLYLPALIKSALEQTGIRPDARAEAMSLEEMSSLFHKLQIATTGSPV
jgi:16S rRNA (adenine1518-N6/adenine1519-N6)-dimethyltransferase